MQDISTLVSSLHIEGNGNTKTPEATQETAQEAANLEPWERYYIENVVEGNSNSGGTTPENLDIEAPISERYKQIKLFRILGYPKQARRERTKMFFDLEAICRAHSFPLFFTLDFEEYQNKKRWTMNGETIKNIKGAFYKFSKAKRERMRENGAWRGHEMENYTYCGANEMDV